MMEPEYFGITAVFTILITALGFMLKSWKNGWETRMTAQDRRLDIHDSRHNEHDMNHVSVSKDLDHIKEATDRIETTVGKILTNTNGKRATG